MIFKDTYRFSPIHYLGDLPHEDDLFHYPYQDIPKSPKDRAEFILDNHIVIDEEWWTKQQERCIHGFTVEHAIDKGGDAIIDGRDAFWHDDSCYIPQYDLKMIHGSVHISGRFYFYLNFWPIYALDNDNPNAKVKSITKPRFLMMDAFFWRRIEMQIERAKDNQECKSRQLGMSEKGGCLLGYNWTFVPGSYNIIVGGEEADALKTMQNADRGLEFLLNTQFYLDRARGGDSATRIVSKTTKSELICLTAKDNPQTVSRYTPYWVWYEEIGKGKADWSIQTAEFVVPSIYAEGKEGKGKTKTGYQTYIGTGGDMAAGAIDLEKRHYSPLEYNILEFDNHYERENDDTVSNQKVGHFTPKWMFLIVDNDGNPCKKQSFTEWELEYNKKIKPKEKFIYFTQFAMYASDAFLISGGGYFGEDITRMLNERKAYINTHRASVNVITCILAWKDPQHPFAGVVYREDPTGWCKIFELPDEDPDGNVPLNLYKAGTDSYDQDESMTTNSKGSICIRKTYFDAEHTYNKFVARITERPSTADGGAERWFEHSAMLCIMYNAINLVEFSKILIINWYITHGFESLLKERPEFVVAAYIMRSKSVNKYGIDPQTKIYWLSLLRDNFLTPENIEKMDDVEMITAFAKFRYDPGGKRYNCDITMSAALAEALVKDEEAIMTMTKSEMDKNVIKPYRTFIVKNGVLVANY